MKYRVLIEQDEDGFFVAEVPALPGCISQGATPDEDSPTSARPSPDTRRAWKRIGIQSPQPGIRPRPLPNRESRQCSSVNAVRRPCQGDH